MNSGPIDATGKTEASKNLTGAGAGNNQLNEAFDSAIREATQTLTITTKKGADLYALKQRPQ